MDCHVLDYAQIWYICSSVYIHIHVCSCVCPDYISYTNTHICINIYICSHIPLYLCLYIFFTLICSPWHYLRLLQIEPCLTLVSSSTILLVDSVLYTKWDARSFLDILLSFRYMVLLIWNSSQGKDIGKWYLSSSSILNVTVSLMHFPIIFLKLTYLKYLAIFW